MPKPETDIDSLIRNRRTVDKFKTEVPSEDLIVQAIESACWAPNHKKTEPWRYYLLGPKTAGRVVELNSELVRQRKGDAAAEKKLKRWSAIPGWLVVTYIRSDNEIRDKENYAAACCAIQNLSLSLWDKGIGIKWTTGDVTRSPEIYGILEVEQQDEEIVGLLWYGFPDEDPKSKRQPVTRVLKQLP